MRQQGRAFFDTLFPDTVYSVKWKRKPCNMLVIDTMATRHRVPPTPTTGPTTISNKATSIRALRGGADSEYTRYGHCVQLLTFLSNSMKQLTEFPQLTRYHLMAIDNKAVSSLIMHFFCPTVSATIGKPNNLAICWWWRLLVLTWWGTFPNQQLPRPILILQQWFPLPPAFDYDDVIANMQFWEPILGSSWFRFLVLPL